jgi:hypothetical protein
MINVDGMLYHRQIFFNIHFYFLLKRFIKDDGTLWLLRIDDPTCQPIHVECPFNLNKVFCFSEKVGVTTSDGEILIRAGCTQDTPEGGGWIFIEHKYINNKKTNEYD